MNLPLFVRRQFVGISATVKVHRGVASVDGGIGDVETGDVFFVTKNNCGKKSFTKE